MNLKIFKTKSLLLPQRFLQPLFSVSCNATSKASKGRNSFKTKYRLQLQRFLQRCAAMPAAEQIKQESENPSVISKPKRGKDKKPRKKGTEHGNWIHGKGKSRPYDSARLSAWKEAVLKKNNYQCFVTGEKKNLVAHHLNSWDWYEKGRYEAENGVTLTEKIHKEFHKNYGQGNNTVAQFEEFLQKNYNKSLKDNLNGNHDPSFSTEVVLLKQQQKAKQLQNEFLELISSRNHELVSGVYQNSSSIVVIKCNNHNTTYETKVTNYKKAKTGMPCCGKVLQSTATSLSNRRRGLAKSEELKEQRLEGEIILPRKPNIS